MSRSGVHTYEVFGETDGAKPLWRGQGGLMKNFRLIGVLLLTATFVFVSCGADPTNFGTLPADTVSNKVTGNVHEWGIDLSAQKATEGEVIFAIANFGSIAHEFIVVKTDYEVGKIPLGENNRFDEEGEGVEAIDEIKEFPVNTSEVLTVNLEAGNYQLLCNIAAHYANGMYAAFIVE
jgi:uncharacterized cupredoxin-like copper-binding protein